MHDIFKNMLLSEGTDSEVINILNEEMPGQMNEEDLPDLLPILPLRNTVLFPGVLLPITVGRQRSIKLIKQVYAGNKLIGTVSQKDPDNDEPTPDDIYTIGTVAQIVKILEMPDDTTTVVIQGRQRVRIESIVQTDPYFKAKVTPLAESENVKKDEEFIALTESLKDLSMQIIKLSSHIPQEAMYTIKNIESPVFLINFICSNSDMEVTKKQHLLETQDIKKRGLELLKYLAVEVQRLKLKDDIQTKVRAELDQQQREYFLNQQMKTIQNELGMNQQDKQANDFRKQAKDKKWSTQTAEVFEKELEKLHRSNPSSPDYSNQINYLQTILDLPWGEYTSDDFDLKKASRILNEEHYGLDIVKERILEHLAVLKLKGDLKAPILCLYGPPGVGKTSLGKSVAQALGRKYVRISLGGLHDESEIRGHRKTYIGAMPGRIIQSLKKAKSSNPVFILDEIDKVGQDFRGDPSSALLEVLDPEQNNTFYDNYLEIEYDLSNVLFIATANDISSIKPALRDRMEMISIPGYLLEEKVEIAKTHLVAKQIEQHGLTKKDISINAKVLEHVVDKYTREAGVRDLEKKIAAIVRKTAKKVAFEEEYNPKIKVSELTELLGPPRYVREPYEGNKIAGIVTGLAWTSSGGEILYVESSLSRGNGKLTITGNLGNVMKESAMLALEYIKANAHIWHIPHKAFKDFNIHIHVPEGAIPKDGPSAGITMATSILSTFTQRLVKKNLAMTGEITLRGKVLPVGGIREKILAAKRANIIEIILSKENKRDIEEIKPEYIKGLTFHYADTLNEVLKIALLDEKQISDRFAIQEAGKPTEEAASTDEA